MKSLFLFLALAASLPVCAQTDRAAAIKGLVDVKSYDFHATTATAMDGMVKSLTSEYLVKITPDSIVGNLPYFGRASAPTMDGDGINFTTKDFSYDSRPTKKGGWEITVRPKDDSKRSVSQVYLSIRSNGLTTIRVMAPNKDPISFDGEITSPGAQ
jgi:Domain of unknown function (DUF4251)